VTANLQKTVTKEHSTFLFKQVEEKAVRFVFIQLMHEIIKQNAPFQGHLLDYLVH